MDYISRYGFEFNPYTKSQKSFLIETSQYREVISRLNYPVDLHALWHGVILLKIALKLFIPAIDIEHLALALAEGDTAAGKLLR